MSQSANAFLRVNRRGEGLSLVRLKCTAGRKPTQNTCVWAPAHTYTALAQEYLFVSLFKLFKSKKKLSKDLKNFSQISAKHNINSLMFSSNKTLLSQEMT